MLDNIILSTYRLESPHTLPCGKGWANTKKNSGTEKIRGGGFVQNKPNENRSNKLL